MKSGIAAFKKKGLKRDWFRPWKQFGILWAGNFGALVTWGHNPRGSR